MCRLTSGMRNRVIANSTQRDSVLRGESSSPSARICICGISSRVTILSSVDLMMMVSLVHVEKYSRASCLHRWIILGGGAFPDVSSDHRFGGTYKARFEPAPRAIHGRAPPRSDPRRSRSSGGRSLSSGHRLRLHLCMRHRLARGQGLLSLSGTAFLLGQWTFSVGRTHRPLLCKQAVHRCVLRGDWVPRYLQGSPRRRYLPFQRRPLRGRIDPAIAQYSKPASCQKLRKPKRSPRLLRTFRDHSEESLLEVLIDAVLRTFIAGLDITMHKICTEAEQQDIVP